MTKCIIYTRIDGGVSVVIPSPNVRTGEHPELLAQFTVDFEELKERGKITPAERGAMDKRLTHIQGRLMTIEEIAAKDVPDGIDFHIVDTVNIPSDRTFRNAWMIAANKIIEDFNGSVAISHMVRRAARATEFAPHDKNANIPMLAEQAEKERVKIRSKFAVIQTDIDKATDTDGLRQIIKRFKS